jgi:hypothetical protein
MLYPCILVIQRDKSRIYDMFTPRPLQTSCLWATRAICTRLHCNPARHRPTATRVSSDLTRKTASTCQPGPEQIASSRRGGDAATALRVQPLWGRTNADTRGEQEPRGAGYAKANSPMKAGRGANRDARLTEKRLSLGAPFASMVARRDPGVNQAREPRPSDALLDCRGDSDAALRCVTRPGRFGRRVRGRWWALSCCCRTYSDLRGVVRTRSDRSAVASDTGPEPEGPAAEHGITWPASRI